jgi:hypothetical protein
MKPIFVVIFGLVSALLATLLACFAMLLSSSMGVSLASLAPVLSHQGKSDDYVIFYPN